jgi:electron transport complex protein RnfA
MVAAVQLVAREKAGEVGMNTMSPMQIFIDACLINNFVLAMFLGICPFLGVSGKTDTAVRMGAAVCFVMLVSSASAFGIHRALVAIDAPYLHLISYIVVIASSVQLVEMFIKKFSPALFRALGIFLPLITTNCAILGVALFQTNRQYDFVQSFSFAIGAGAGFTLALVLMSGIRERLELADVSSVVRGAALTLMIAGILSMAFMGFAGMGK